MRRKTIIACCIGIGLYIGCSLWPHHSEFDDKGTLEDAMGMEIPNYKVKEYISDPIIDCHGDFSDKIVIEFEEIPSKQFIDSVNQRVVADTLRNDKRWLKFDEHRYCFQACYGDGGRTPKCRKGQQDWLITLDFSDNSTEGIINYSYW
jgi:uncharacterized protein YbaA (DUF1428 family)